ncbi:hypothetical protein GCM10027577_32070 [Spirosoma fluminis]
MEGQRPFFSDETKASTAKSGWNLAVDAFVSSARATNGPRTVEVILEGKQLNGGKGSAVAELCDWQTT